MGVLYCPRWIPITVCCPDILAWGVPFSVFLQGWCARGNLEMSYFLFISEGHFCWIVNSWLPVFSFQHVEYVVALLAGLSGVWWEAGHHLHRGPCVCHELILSYCIQDSSLSFLAFDILMMCVKVWLSSSLIYLGLIKDFRCVHERFSFSLAVLPIIFQMPSPPPWAPSSPQGLPLCSYCCDWWCPVPYFRVSGHSLFFLSLSLEKVLDASLSLLLPPASSPNVPSSPPKVYFRCCTSPW